MTAAAFERFRWSFLDDASDSFREGLDKEALAELEGDERARAEELLIAMLPDIRGVIGLGVLRSRRAVPELESLFAEERPAVSWKLIALAEALWRIEPDRRWLDAEIAALERAASWQRRKAAALALREFREPEAARALVKALDDQEPLVRHHAAASLLVLHGVLDGQPEDAPVGHPIYKVMAPDRATRDAAKQALLASVAGRPIVPGDGR